MKSNELGNKIKQFNELLILEMPRINESVAMNAYALVRNRVTNTGVIGSGKSLGSYSDTELPAFFSSGKSLNNAGEKFVEKAKKERTQISYKEFREANNRPTDHISLSFSGEMWKDIGVIKEYVTGTKIVTVVGAKNTKRRSHSGLGSDLKMHQKEVSTDTIMDGHAERYGDFLEVNLDEETRLAKTYDTMLQDLIDKTFE